MSMNERERLLAILYDMPEAMSLSEMADYLLEHGITAPPTEIDGEYAEKKTIERRVIIDELNRIGNMDLISSRLNYCPICGKLIKEGKNNG